MSLKNFYNLSKNDCNLTQCRNKATSCRVKSQFSVILENQSKIALQKMSGRHDHF